MAARRVNRVRVHLDDRGIDDLGPEELRAILRGADELIATGGRSLLAQILKGAKRKRLLELGLDACPVYGYYRDLSLEEITARIDWTILNGYLAIEYDYRLPVLVFTNRGWEIERETRANEFLDQIRASTVEGGSPFDPEQLKDRNRDMILLLLDKIEDTGDPALIPFLEAWKKVDYKKVRMQIGHVVRALGNG